MDDNKASLTRIPAAKAEECIGCDPDGRQESLRKGEYFLILDLPYCQLTLCHKHEMAVLQLLLSNYIRRVRRGKEKTKLFRPEDSEVEEIKEDVAWVKHDGMWVPVGAKD